jgi:hypothetical protein
MLFLRFPIYMSRWRRRVTSLAELEWRLINQPSRIVRDALVADRAESKLAVEGPERPPTLAHSRRVLLAPKSQDWPPYLERLAHKDEEFLEKGKKALHEIHFSILELVWWRRC